MNHQWVVVIQRCKVEGREEVVGGAVAIEVEVWVVAGRHSTDR